MSEELNIWKAKAIARGKLLERFRDTIQNITDTADNEGDRVYFRSTNEYDELRQIGDEMAMWNWDGIIRERPERDPYADCRELRTALAAKDAEISEIKLRLDASEVFEATFKNQRDELLAEIERLKATLDIRVGDLVMLRRAFEEGDPKKELLFRIDDMIRETRAALKETADAL